MSIQMLQDNAVNDSEEIDDEDEWAKYAFDFNMEIVEKTINQKYSAITIQRYIEKIYYFDSLQLLGNWNLFLISFKEMEIVDCIGYFFYLKQNGFLEDVTYHNRFDSEEQIKNADLFFSINEKSKLQITKIAKNDEDMLIDENFKVMDDSSDDQDSPSDFLDIPVDDEISNIPIDDQNAKILPKLPKTKYYHYKDYKPIVNRAIKYFSIGKKAMWIHKQTGIPYTTLRDWQVKYKKNNLFRPYIIYRRSKYFTEEEDIALNDEIKRRMIGNRFNSISFLKILNEHFLRSKFHHDKPNVKPKFNAQWISRWRRHWRISLRKYHIRRRRLNDPEEAEKFRSLVLEAIEKYGESNVFNMDETSWGLVPHDERVWAPKGADDVTFDVYSNYPEKTRFTAIATITASGEKLDLTVIAKGTTVRCEKSFRKNLNMIIKHSKNGWSTVELMKCYLKTLSELRHGQPICLIWDRYRAHTSDKVEDYAKELKIEIIKVPAGQTGTEQPLDRLIFGSMKKTADQLWNEKIANSEQNIFTRETASAILAESWKRVKTTTVKKAWNHIFTNKMPETEEFNRDNDWYFSNKEEEEEEEAKDE